MTMLQELYEYDFDPSGSTAAARVLRLVGSGKRVLEVGCAAGSQTRHLQRNGCAVTALEINAEAAERARPFCDRLIVGNIESMDLSKVLGSTTFDAAIFSDVLEHLRDPLAVLGKVKPYLANGGCILASIPNVTHASLVFELMHGRFEYRSTGLLDRTHIRFFAKLGIMQLFEAAGYVVDHLERVTANPGETEFSTKAVSAEDREALDYILSKNPEALTYQFILRALPLAEASRPPGAAELYAAAKIQELEELAEVQQKELLKLRSELEWMAKSPWNRAVCKLRDLFRAARPSKR